MELNFKAKFSIAMVVLMAASFVALSFMQYKPGIVTENWGALMRARAGYKVTIEKEGTGAIVVPGRVILLNSGHSGGGIIAIHNHVFEVGKGAAPYPINQYESALMGLREGAIATIKSESGGIGDRVQIRRVCNSSLPIPFLACFVSADRDEVSGPLKGCTEFTSQPCKDAVTRAFQTGSEPALPFIEYCLLESKDRCDSLVKHLSLLQAERREVPRVIEELLPYSTLTVEQVSLMTTQMAKTPEDKLRAVSDLLRNLSPQTVGPLLGIIDEGGEAADIAVSELVSRATSTIGSEKQTVISLLGGAHRPVPERIQFSIAEKNKARAEIEKMRSIVEASDAESSLRKLAESNPLGSSELTDQDLITPHASGYSPISLAGVWQNGMADFGTRATPELLNARDAFGSSYVHYMVMIDNYFSLKWFLETYGSKVDFELQDKNGRTVIDIAKSRADFATVNLIEAIKSKKSR